MKVILTIIVILTICNLPSKELHYVRAEPIIEKPKSQKEEIREIIKQKAQKYSLNENMMDEIILCESTYNPKAIHDGHKGVGVTGFHKTTFELWLKKYEKETNQTLNYDSTFDQLELMSWAFTKGEKFRLNWTTYRAYINGGTYSFYSKSLKKQFTVTCG